MMSSRTKKYIVPVRFSQMEYDWLMAGRKALGFKTTSTLIRWALKTYLKENGVPFDKVYQEKQE